MPWAVSLRVPLSLLWSETLCEGAVEGASCWGVTLGCRFDAADSWWELLPGKVKDLLKETQS